MNPDLPEQPDEGDVFAGVGIGCGIQLICLFLSIVVFYTVHDGKAGGLLLAAWGVTQWIGIIPLIFYFKGRGKSNTILGMLITGGIGLLLSSACAS
jgi:hypothetical protein